MKQRKRGNPWTPPRQLGPEVLKDGGLLYQGGPFLMKMAPKLCIGMLKDRRKLCDGRFLDCLIDAYRDIFGHGSPVDKKSWGEYAQCQGSACRRMLSFEAAYNLESYVYIPDFEGSPPFVNLPRCPSCQSLMSLFYLPHKLCEEMKREFLQYEIFGVFLVGEDGRVYGFSYGWVDSLEGVWEKRFQEFYRSSAVTLEVCQSRCREYFNCERPLFYWAESGHLLFARGRSVLFAMNRLLISEVLNSVGDMQCLFSTIPRSNAHALMVGAGARVVYFARRSSPSTSFGKDL